ncbi:MAG TPA: Flp pilus assembly protein CpaB [Xanthobacteraceae bacterium]|nr:Flp pilus assembly protein CpaB [Xanthobacteraceae bacterium]
MKATRLVVLGIAIAAGGVAALLAGRGHETEAPPPAPVVALDTVDVLIAKVDLGRGQVIEPSQIGWQIWPATAANENFIKKAARPDAVNQFVGAIVRVPVAAGQPIYDPMVVLAKGSGFLAAILPKGMRAVAVDIAADSDAGGFILPEDHVDILLTRHDKAAEKNTGNETIVTDTILRNVRVLAVDQAVQEKSGQKVIVGKTATIELAPEQAETLADARQVGTLSLSLRSLVDSQSSAPEGGDHKYDGTSVNLVRYGVGGATH